MVAVIDAHIRIGGPEEYGVDSAVALFEIAKIPIDGVSARDRIIEIAVVDHHLWLHEARLSPPERGQIISRTAVADANAPFVPPVGDIGEPCFVFALCAGLRPTLPSAFHYQTVGRRNLLSLGTEPAVL